MTPSFTWPKSYQAAVSLTFDDGLRCHTQWVAPQLELYGLRATFYPQILSDLRLHPEDWTNLAQRGHEIGNHTIFHPCRGEPEIKRPWVEPGTNLLSYTVRHWCEEVEAANFILSQLDGQTERTFGNTCFETMIGVGDTLTSLEPLILERFVAARGEHTRKPILPWQANLANLGTYDIDGFTADKVIPKIESAFQYNQWLIFTMHGVGSDSHRLNIESEELTKILAYLASHQQHIWCAPLIEIARTIRDFQK